MDDADDAQIWYKKRNRDLFSAVGGTGLTLIIKSIYYALLWMVFLPSFRSRCASLMRRMSASSNSLLSVRGPLALTDVVALFVLLTLCLIIIIRQVLT